MARASLRLRALREHMSPSSMLSKTIALPEELWLGIFACFDRKHDKSTILALRQVNKTFSRLATPLVFCRLAPILTPLVPRKTKSPERLTVGPWIARIAQQPGFISLVKEIDFRAHDSVPHDNRIDAEVDKKLLPVYEQLLAMMKGPAALFQDLGPLVDEAWTDREAKYRMTTLLLCEAVEEQLARAHLEAIQKAAPASIPLANVTTVNCEANTAYPVDFKFALQWLSLPRLKSLKINGLGDHEPGSVYMLPKLDDQDIRQSGPIELHFDYSTLGHDGLRYIIAACAGRISLTVRWCAGLWTEKIQWDEIGNVLRQYGTRFDHVLIDATAAWRIETNRTFGDLSNTQIRSLGIPYSSLVNAIREGKAASSHLPVNLERLTLLGTDAAHRTKLLGKNLMSARPHLTDVRAAPWYRYQYEEWYGREWNQCVDYNVVPDLGLQRAHGG